MAPFPSDSTPLSSPEAAPELYRAPENTSRQSAEPLPPQSNPQIPPEKNKVPGDILSFLFELGLILLIVWVIRSFLATPFQIEGNSMNDTLLDQEKIFVSRLSNYMGDIERGDIIVFKPPHYRMIAKSGPVCFVKRKLFPNESDLKKLCGEEPQQYVKRVIGIAGDMVEIRGGKVYLTPADGEKIELAETYLNAENSGQTCFDRLACSADRDRLGQKFVVPEGTVFVLGDNRMHSSDSRSAFETGSAFHGSQPDPFVPLENIAGKAKIVIWPLDNLQLL